MSNPPQMEKHPARRPAVPEESAYEQLEERSERLNEERRKGGPGTSQAPDAATPLLHPSDGKTGRDDDTTSDPAGERREKT